VRWVVRAQCDDREALELLLRSVQPSLAEVAAILEIPLGTVKSRLAYGLTVLRRHLTDKTSP
jgi:DNA-directed RNA polymerase specialized sigma24 family protein